MAEQVARLARFELAPAEDVAGGEPVASVAVPGGAVQVLVTDAVDPEEAERRVAAERVRLAREVERAEAKLANQGFVAKAPAPVVEAERAKLSRLRSEMAELG